MFFNSHPAVSPNLLHAVKALLHDWGYFRIPKSPVHIQLSPSVNYAIQWQGQKEKERNGDEIRQRAAAYVLFWYSMLRGRYVSRDFFCSCSGFAEWPLWAPTLDCRKHTHIHTHTLKNLDLSNRHTNTFYEHPKSINTSFFIKLWTPHVWNPLIWKWQHLLHLFFPLFVSACFGLGGAFPKGAVQSPVEYICINVKCWVSVRVFFLNKKQTKD